MGVGVIYLMATTRTITVPPRDAHWASLGQWMIYMSVISFTTAAAGLARDRTGALAQALLGTGAACAAVGLLAGSATWEQIAGWVFVAAAAVAIVAGATLMLAAVYGSPFGGLGGRTRPVAYDRGDPGVKVGQ
jgi:hypothetical protein